MDTKKLYKISNIRVEAAQQVDWAVVPNDFEYMPAGSHTICCTVNGEAREITVVCDESCAKIFQDSLDAVNAAYDRGEMSRPFVDFDHENKEAAAFPKRFFWKDGLRLEVEWTVAGRQAIEEKRYNYCSPMFFVDDDGKPCGVNYPGSIAALVNVPAFQSIQKISAKLTNSTQTKESDMSENKNEELEKQLKQKDDEINALKAQLEEQKGGSDGKKDEEIAALKAKVADLEKANKDAADKAACARKSAIEKRVDSLIECGRLKAEAKAAYVAAALASEDDGEALFGGLAEVVDAPLNLGKKSAAAKSAVGAKEREVVGLEVAAAAFNKQIEALNK